MWSIKKIAAFFSILTLILVSCTPEDGDTGAVGPVGPEGAIGPAGSSGAALSVSTFDVPSLSWVGGATKTFAMGIPDITPTIVNNGTIQVFQTETPLSPVWGALPYTYGILLTSQTGTVTAEVNIQYEYKADSLLMSVTNSLLANITGSATFPGDRSFKVVIIPPSQKIDGFEPSTYEEAKMVYGFKD